MAASRYAELHEPLSIKYSPRWIPLFLSLFSFSPYEIMYVTHTDHDEYNQFTSTLSSPSPLPGRALSLSSPFLSSQPQCPEAVCSKNPGSIGDSDVEFL